MISVKNPTKAEYGKVQITSVFDNAALQVLSLQWSSHASDGYCAAPDLHEIWSDGRSAGSKNYAQGSFARQFSAVLSIQILRILNGRLTQVIELGIGGISTFKWYVRINPLAQVSF